MIQITIGSDTGFSSHLSLNNQTSLSFKTAFKYICTGILDW